MWKYEILFKWNIGKNIVWENEGNRGRKKQTLKQKMEGGCVWRKAMKAKGHMKKKCNS